VRIDDHIARTGDYGLAPVRARRADLVISAETPLETVVETVLNFQKQRGIQRQ